MSTQTIPPPSLLDELQHAGSQRQQRLTALWRLSAAERVEVMRSGRLTLEQLAAWSARHPHQVPQLNGEFEWIAANTPEVCE